MATVTIASPSTITSNLSYTFETISNNSHEDSFATYLNLIRENLALQELGHDSIQNPNTMRISIGKGRTEAGELDIFRAEKYFSGVMDDDSKTPIIPSERARRSSFKKDGKMIVSLKSRSGTESSCSETSANSRNTLLCDHRKKPAASCSELKRNNSKKFLRVFRCSCAGKDATKVDKEEVYPQNYKTEMLTERIVLGFKREGVPIGPFGSPFVEKAFVGSNRRKSSPFSTSAGVAAAAGGGGGGDNDDLRSESSSDLFEIESLSINVHPLFIPEPSYEPSEASIEWSVATASVGHDDRKSEPIMKKAPKSHKPALLLGCVNNKAVSVTTEIYEKPERVNSGRPDRFDLETLPPVARYHASQAIYTR
ncbi:hypothetical protein J5N97_005767 [Dioscorea zingiberensis]|uniref:Uncharacterized protein n=1 Tax=Dioscorea zingiberensis TaxID=325984 RepID=A0A9D5D8M5_9LILI|nr:hypothetical protein J5N97_005767 [Dioscorea zingiberensis]